MRRCDSGFTLIELMVVVLIIAALAGMVLPRLMDRPDEAKIKIAQGDMANIKTVLKLYYFDNGKYPSDDEGLNALMVKTSSGKNWKGPYLEMAPNDPWKNPYHYKFIGKQSPVPYHIWSDGPDTQTPDDDVRSWQE